MPVSEPRATVVQRSLCGQVAGMTKRQHAQKDCVYLLLPRHSKGCMFKATLLNCPTGGSH